MATPAIVQPFKALKTRPASGDKAFNVLIKDSPRQVVVNFEFEVYVKSHKTGYWDAVVAVDSMDMANMLIRKKKEEPFGGMLDFGVWQNPTYEIQQHTAEGWEQVYCSNNKRLALINLRIYKESQPVIRTRMVKVTGRDNF